jgi:hypothetical protein
LTRSISAARTADVPPCCRAHKSPTVTMTHRQAAPTKVEAGGCRAARRWVRRVCKTRKQHMKQTAVAATSGTSATGHRRHIDKANGRRRQVAQGGLHRDEVHNSKFQQRNAAAGRKST